MTRTGIRAFGAAVLALAAVALAPAGSSATGESAGAVPGRARLTMDELEIRGYEQKPARFFVPPVPDMFHRSAVRFDLILEDLAKPIPLSEIGNETHRTGGYLVDDD